MRGRPQKRLRIELLPDYIEVVFYSAGAAFGTIQVEKLTPLGVVYLLASHANTTDQFAAVTGKDVQTLAQSARTKLQSLYRGTENIVATEETVTLLEKALEEAGPPNTATVGYLLLAVFTMRDANKTDAYKFLVDKDINKGVIENALREGKGTLPPEVEKFTTDAIAEFLAVNEPLHEHKCLKALANDIAACLTKKRGNKVLIWGHPGVGRHTLIRQLALTMAREQYGRLKGYQLRRIATEKFSRGPQAQQEIRALLEKLPEKVIILIDSLRLVDLKFWQPLLNCPNPLIAITSTAEVRRLETEVRGIFQNYEIKEPPRKEVVTIVKKHLPDLVTHHQLGLQRFEDRAIEALIKFGPMITGLSLPGAAVQLLDHICSQDAVSGDKVLTLEDVAREVSERTGIPVTTLTETEADRLRRLPQILEQRIVGQEEAKEVIQQALRRKRMGLADPNRPILVAVFVGPTGVGKTEMVKALAEFLFDNEKAVSRIDMSEYKHDHTVSRLIGSPPGYVGYHEGGQLTGAIRRRPFSIIHFDEIDKAHPAVYDVLLQLFDEGRLTDGQGYTVDARHTIIVCTGNPGSRLIYDGLTRGRSLEEIKKDTLAWFRRSVRPEFFNRIDRIVFFHPLDKDHLQKIANLMLNNYVIQPVATVHSIQVEVTPAARELLVELGYDQTLGARPLRRVIEEL